MNQQISMIDNLVDQMQPVKTIKKRHGLMMCLSALVALSIIVVMSFGMRQDMSSLQPSSALVLRSFVLLVLGFSAALAIFYSVHHPDPEDGKFLRFVRKSWKYTLLLSIAFPILAAMSLLTEPPTSYEHANNMLKFNTVIKCVSFITIGAMSLAFMMAFWAKKGLITNPQKASWLIGIASGGFAGAAYSLHCVSDTLVYNGSWFTVSILLTAILSRVILPHILRW